MDMQEALQTFVIESRELLEAMEQALLQLLDGGEVADPVNAIFRAAHTIKGSAGLFGLDFIVEFTHVVESVLDRVRDGAVPLDEALVTLLLGCSDHIGALVGIAATGRDEAGPDLAEAARPLLAALGARLVTARPDDAGPSESASAPGAAPTAASAPSGAGDDEAGARWHISLRFGTEVLRNGMDPLSFVRYLGRLGRVGAVVLLPDAVPALAELDPESCHLGLEIDLRTAAPLAAIEGAFEFVRDDCEVRIDLQAGDDAAVGAASSASAPAAAGAEPVGAAMATTSDSAVPAASPAEPANRTAPKPRDTRAGDATVRVDADKLDRLIDLVGELITATASATVAGQALGNGALHEAHSTLAGLVQELRDSALQLRMVRIGATFSRFQRVVHDVARELGKDIALAISGEETELDKTVVEKIADPLTHLVRNSMDHGIEPAALRSARGKPLQGRVTLNAYHDSGSIVIEVGDDGGGLDRERILAKAVERGMVEPGRVLSDTEVYGLIFEPGFSTAAQVTNLSGRGVGMDVVKRNITALRGAVAVASQPGVGTTVTVRLPLTLAIINGFQVVVGRSVFVLPLESVEECVELGPETGHDYAELRGEILPFIRAHRLFRITPLPNARQNIVVLKHGSQRFGLIVDRLLGEAQTVIKPLASMFSHLHGISGSSILGSGDVALILDVAALANRALAGATSPA